jgi:two-component system, chemotaxis family, chemotaxis protein CheY
MSTKPFRVLLVDDSAPFRRQVGGALEASGLSVVEATEGMEGLWRARSEGVFDLVLLDIHMPNMDGLTFIREVRKLTGYANVPIVVVTSDGSRERRLEGRSVGATAWLLKPPDLPGLINAVHASLMRIIKPADANESLRPRTLSLALDAGESARSELLPPRSQRALPRSEATPARDARPRTEEPPARFAPVSGDTALRSGPPQSARMPNGAAKRSDRVGAELMSERRAPRSERPLSSRLDGPLPARPERGLPSRPAERSERSPKSERERRSELPSSRSLLLPRPEQALSRSEQPQSRVDSARLRSEQPQSRVDSARLRSEQPQSRLLPSRPRSSEARRSEPPSPPEPSRRRSEPSAAGDGPGSKLEP